MKSQEPLSNYGPIPEPIDNDRDTEPNLFASANSFAAQPSSEVTAPRCYLCGTAAWDSDEAFERGVAFALTQVQGLLQQGALGVSLDPDQAAALADWFRRNIQPR
jgi:hypothetical protein